MINRLIQWKKTGFNVVRLKKIHAQTHTHTHTNTHTHTHTHTHHPTAVSGLTDESMARPRCDHPLAVFGLTKRHYVMTDSQHTLTQSSKATGK